MRSDRSMNGPSCRVLLSRLANSRQDFFVVRPGPAQEFGEQSALSGKSSSTVHEDVELPSPTLLELDGCFQILTDESSETRCFLGSCSSGLAVDDSDCHR